MMVDDRGFDTPSQPRSRTIGLKTGQGGRILMTSVFFFCEFDLIQLSSEISLDPQYTFSSTEPDMSGCLKKIQAYEDRESDHTAF